MKNKKFPALFPLSRLSGLTYSHSKHGELDPSALTPDEFIWRIFLNHFDIYGMEDELFDVEAITAMKVAEIDAAECEIREDQIEIGRLRNEPLQEIEKRLFESRRDQRHDEVLKFASYNHENLINLQALDKFKQVSDELPNDLVRQLLLCFDGWCIWNPKMLISCDEFSSDDAKKYQDDLIKAAEDDIIWQSTLLAQKKKDLILLRQYLPVMLRLFPRPAL